MKEIEALTQTDFDRVLQESPDSSFLVAVTPKEMAVAQTELIDWCKKKKAEVQQEHRDLKENLAIAAKNKWRVSTLRRSLTLSERRRSFYAKIHSALSQGYLIIPNLPMELLAIRVQRRVPTRKENTSFGDQKLQKPDLLPEGAGAYVSAEPKIFEETRSIVNSKQEVVDQKVYWAEEFQDVAFPVIGIKPVLLQAAEQALALKVFDAIGIVPPAERYDPILVGRLYNPRGFGTWAEERKCVSFFLGWWFNPRALE